MKLWTRRTVPLVLILAIIGHTNNVSAGGPGGIAAFLGTLLAATLLVAVLKALYLRYAGDDDPQEPVAESA